MKWIIFTVPFLILIDMIFISWIFEQISAANDIQVFIGVTAICLLILVHYFFIKYLIKKV